MTFLDPTRLLSVQSHVVSGYVGNRAATFPLQLLGYDVDVVNTVQFSNHTGYGHTNGHKTTAEQIDLVFRGLETNGLCRWSRCLTGYIPGAEAVEAVGKEIRSLKSRAKEQGEDVLYLLDPVMGDIGKGLYVPQDVVPVYRSLLPLASIITPNQFETELLSETKITDLSTLSQALRVLHTRPYGVKHVVISSIPFPRRLVEKMRLPGLPGGYRRLRRTSGGAGQQEDDEEDEVLVCFASTSTTTSDGTRRMDTYGYALPTIRGYYSGVGDLFSALVLGCFERAGGRSGGSSEGKMRVVEEGEELNKAVGLALWGVQVVLLKTHQGTLAHQHQHQPHNDEPTRNPQVGHGQGEGTTSCIPSDEELDEASTRDPTNVHGPSRRAKRMRLRELRIVQERQVLGRLGARGGDGHVQEEEERWLGKKLDWDVLLRG